MTAVGLAESSHSTVAEQKFQLKAKPPGASGGCGLIVSLGPCCFFKALGRSYRAPLQASSSFQVNIVSGVFEEHCANYLGLRKTFQLLEFRKICQCSLLSFLGETGLVWLYIRLEQDIHRQLFIGGLLSYTRHQNYMSLNAASNFPRFNQHCPMCSPPGSWLELNQQNKLESQGRP